MALRKPQDPAAQDRLEPVPEADYSLPPVRRLTPEQSREYFDETARELLGISGETFIERWHSGRYKDILDDPAHADIMYLTLLGNVGRSEWALEMSAMAVRRQQIDEPLVDLDADDAVDPSLPPMRLLTIRESQAFFNDMTRELLGISGDEFIRRYHTGRYDDILDDPHHSDLIYLAMLGGLGR